MMCDWMISFMCDLREDESLEFVDCSLLDGQV